MKHMVFEETVDFGLTRVLGKETAPDWKRKALKTQMKRNVFV